MLSLGCDRTSFTYENSNTGAMRSHGNQPASVPRLVANKLPQGLSSLGPAFQKTRSLLECKIDIGAMAPRNELGTG